MSNTETETREGEDLMHVAADAADGDPAEAEAVEEAFDVSDEPVPRDDVDPRAVAEQQRAAGAVLEFAAIEDDLAGQDVEPAELNDTTIAALSEVEIDPPVITAEELVNKLATSLGNVTQEAERLAVELNTATVALATVTSERDAHAEQLAQHRRELAQMQLAYDDAIRRGAEASDRAVESSRRVADLQAQIEGATAHALHCQTEAAGALENMRQIENRVRGRIAGGKLWVVARMSNPRITVLAPNAAAALIAVTEVKPESATDRITQVSLGGDAPLVG